MNLIYKPFNGTFFLVLFVSYAIYQVLVSIAAKRGKKFAENMITVICLLTMVGFFIYKYYLSIDVEYNSLPEVIEIGAFSWWAELPLNTCNVNMWSLPLAIKMKKRGFLSYVFFSGFIGAVMAIIMPIAGFDHFSIFKPRMIGFLTTHLVLIWCCVALYRLDIYRPKLSDIGGCLLAGIVLSLCMFGVNTVLRMTSLAPHANYFFTCEPSGNAILEMMYRLVPVQYVFAMPLLLVLPIAIILFTTVEKGIRALKRKPASE